MMTQATPLANGHPSAAPIASGTAAGFAQAVRPVIDTHIVTDSDGLVAGDITIPTADGAIPGYRAAPKGQTQLPVILVIQEIFGVHEHIKDVTRRLAKLGYLAIAPELFARQGDVSKLANVDEIRPLVAKVDDAQVLTDLDSAVSWAEQHGGDSQRLGITGFCWGGRITWLYAAHQPKLKAAVAWYGRLIGQASALQPRFPLDVATQLKAPVLGLYGGQDQGIPLDTVQQTQAVLHGGPSTIHVYPEAPHAFFADYRPNYRAEAANDGWQRLQDWFHQHGL